MINIHELDDYITPVEEMNGRVLYLTGDIRRFEVWLEDTLSLYINCEKTDKDGRRLVQTNFLSYKEHISIAIKCIDALNVSEETKDEYRTKILNKHLSNLKFEEEHGLEYNIISKSKKKSTPKHKKNVQTEMFENKETAAQRKLKAHALKISALSINIKPI